MMGGPIDTRQAPTAVNTLATQRPFSWFEQNVIATVPMIYPGAGRKVYPGFLQLAGFMTMNLGSHLISHWEMFKHLVVGDDEEAASTQRFYDEYRSVCDMTAEFYLQTVDVVFQQHLLPKGELEHRGRLVGPTRSATRRCWRSRASATIFRASARPRPRSTSRPGCRRPRSNISWPRTSAITASSTAASGARRSRRSWKSSSPPTTRVRRFSFSLRRASSARRCWPARETAADTNIATWNPPNSCGAFARQHRAEQGGGDQAAGARDRAVEARRHRHMLFLDRSEHR